MAELTASTSGDCLDLEDLAAFADGRLTGSERDRAVQHVADCERCYDIFSEVVQLQEDEREEEATDVLVDEAGGGERLAEVIEHPRSRSWWRPGAGAVAAAALIALVAAPWLRDGRFPPPAAGWDEHPDWVTLRRVSFLSPEAQAFRLGVRSTDLVVALEAGRSKPAEEHSASLAGLAAGFEHATEARNLLLGLRARLREGEQPSGLVRDAKRAVGLLEDIGSPPPYYRLGRWVEEGRKAALVGDREFFKSGKTRRFLEYLERFEASPEISGDLLGQLAAGLDDVRSRIAAEPTGGDLESLERALKQVADLAANRLGVPELEPREQ